MAVERAVTWLPTVALFVDFIVSGGGNVFGDFAVVAIDDLLHVAHAGVANLYGVFVEYWM